MRRIVDVNETLYNVNINGKFIELNEKEVLTNIDAYENRLKDELDKFNKMMLQKSNNLAIYLSHLEKRLVFTEWINKKLEIQKKSSDLEIYQRQIFYCQLGNNIGSEQNGRRPVVVLQNNLGNRDNTTIIAPITTHNGEIKKENEKHYILINDADGKMKKKYLGYYEVPIELECQYTQEIKGFINIAHIIEVDKKRFEKIPVAKITTGNFSNVITAINRNFRLST